MQNTSNAKERKFLGAGPPFCTAQMASFFLRDSTALNRQGGGASQAENGRLIVINGCHMRSM